MKRQKGGNGDEVLTPEDTEDGHAAARRPHRELTKHALRASSGPVGRAMLVAFGIGIGVAVSVAVVDSEDEFRTVGVEGGIDAPEAAVVEEETTQEGGVRYVTRGGTGSGGAGAQQGATQAVGQQGAGGPSAAILNPADYQCAAGKNGGSTDTGVTGNSIKVAANKVTDGPGASFLKEAIVGMRAVIDEVNVEGICGRKVILQDLNDGWDRSKGLQYIENYVNEGAFALVVNPSSEGLDAAIQNKTIDNAGLPVVGSDGMLICQYSCDVSKNPPGPLDDGAPGVAQWVWPVAASTVSTMHIVVQHAAETLKGEGFTGAKKFALVYDKFYKFGSEGKDAFLGAVNRLKGTYGLEDPVTLGINPGQTDYDKEKADFNDACLADTDGDGKDDDPVCGLVALLLTSSDAQTWIKSGATFAPADGITTGPQTLFNRSFAQNCVQLRTQFGPEDRPACSLIVWTGYNPPVGALANLPDVNKYVADVKRRNGQADTDNSFTEGAYLGARLFVDALKQVGPNVTRENLKNVLNSMRFKSDLVHADGLAWSAGSHFANTRMQAFRVGFTPAQGFTGWQSENTGWVEDRWPGRY